MYSSIISVCKTYSLLLVIPIRDCQFPNLELSRKHEKLYV